MHILPFKCRRYLEERGLNFEEVAAGEQKGIVLREFRLPEGRFNTSVADLLVFLPAGYPDNPPDMFFALPWIKLAVANCYPKAADQPFQFHGQQWQRWSRHNNTWRPGVDGIWTMLKRVETALKEAA